MSPSLLGEHDRFRVYSKDREMWDFMDMVGRHWEQASLHRL